MGTLDAQFAACGLVLHPQKTKLACCKDINRRGDFPVQSFDFLGYTFRPRKVIWRGGRYGVSFPPAASQDALKAIRQTLRRWELHRRSGMALDDLVRRYNPYVRGRINYCSHDYKSALAWTLRRVDAFLVRWVRNKFKRLRPRQKGARDWLARMKRTVPKLSPIGSFCMSAAGHREPYESRGSSTVLGTRGGETPPRDLTAPPILLHQPKLAGEAAGQLPHHRQPDRRNHDQNGPGGSVRAGHRGLPPRASASPTRTWPPSTFTATRSMANGTTPSRHINLKAILVIYDSS